jgi:serine/threonine protein kinase
MSMSLLGPNLTQLFDFCHQKFSVKTIIQIGIQLIQRIQVLHSLSFVHRDLKPDNICLGYGKNQNVVYLIDFGLAKRFVSPLTCMHNEQKKSRAVVGTI